MGFVAIDSATEGMVSYFTVTRKPESTVAMSEPQLQYAIFCKKVIDKPREFSIIDVFDSLKVEEVWEGKLPSKLPPRPYTFKLVIGIIGLKKGEHRIWVDCKPPFGRYTERSTTQDFALEESPVTHRVIIDFQLDIVGSGTYTFPVWLDDNLLTKLQLPVEFKVKRTRK